MTETTDADRKSGARRASRGRAAGLAATLVTLSLIASFAVAEVFLRVAPEVIGVPVLARFPAPLRQVVADRLGLPSINAYVVIAPSERTDGGPPLAHPHPGSDIRRALDDADAEAGAIETVRMDSRGFCNPAEAAARPQADLVTLGDSFAFCTAVTPEDTATAMLGAMTGRPSYDLGTPAIGLHEYVQLLRRYGLALKPKAVVMMVYEGNDLRDADRFAAFTRTGAAREEDEASFEALVSRSYAASLIFAAASWIRRDFRLFGDGKSIDFGYSALAQGRRTAMNVTNSDTGEPRYADRLRDGEVSLDLWRAPLEAFRALGAENGFAQIVAYVPSMYTAYASTVRFDDAGVGASVTAASERQRAWLKAEAERLGIAFVDLVPPLQRAAATGPLTHFPANVHLTPFGHQIAAEALKPAVEAALAGAPPQ